MAQYNDFISEINKAPENYDGEAVLQRMIEGAGFRYYWATEGMSQTSADFKPCNDCRSTLETLQHLLSLSEMVKSTLMGEVFDRSRIPKSDDFEVLIKATNSNWAESANYMTEVDASIEEMQIDFGNGSKVSFWNLLNGPLADAIYHTGQVVSFRRMSGNPINAKVNVFMGKLND
jgi:hypothetical protein